MGTASKGPAGAGVSRGEHLPLLGTRSPAWVTPPTAGLCGSTKLFRPTPWVHHRQAESALGQHGGRAVSSSSGMLGEP